MEIIDLSEHNGSIDFEKVKNQGITNVILRVGWIGNKQNHTLDKRFNEYYKEAKLHGFNVGIYVFCYCKNLDTLKQGIKWTLDVLQNKVIELPVYLDVEDDPESNSYLSKIGRDTLTRMCILFCKEVQNAGYKAGIYANKNFFDNYIYHSLLLDYSIWWAEYNSKIHNTYKVDLWQYTSKGKVDGINTNVDMNISFGNFEANTNSTTQENLSNGDDVEVKSYVNGSTVEPVYSDTNLTNKIGSINPRETCECLGIYQNRAIVRYKVDNQNNYKIGFVKWIEGVQ